MKTVTRNPMRHELFDLLARQAEEAGLEITDREVVEKFLKRVEEEAPALQQDRRLRTGSQAQEMFGAMLVSLGRTELIKEEDAGCVYHRRDRMVVPDFRVFLRDGSKMLVEVKKHYQKDDAQRPFVCQRRYIKALRNYGEAMNLPVKLAIYFERWNIWTMVDLSVGKPGRRRAEVEFSMMDAMSNDEMVRLGDYMIGTRPPLSLRVLVESEEMQEDADGQLLSKVRVRGVEYTCNGKVVTDRKERFLAHLLMTLGRWPVSEGVGTFDESGRRLVSVEHVAEPDTPDGEEPEVCMQGFAMVCSLSEMFSAYYKFAAGKNLPAEGGAGEGQLVLPILALATRSCSAAPSRSDRGRCGRRSGCFRRISTLGGA